jgi:hypothetical protein
VKSKLLSKASSLSSEVLCLSNASDSGVTTMGSDRANAGAPNPNGPNGGPKAQAVEQKHWPGPLICHNVVF